MAHLMAVNQWNEEDAMLYLGNVFEVWQRRSAEDWTLDISWMKHRGKAPTGGLEGL